MARAVTSGQCELGDDIRKASRLTQEDDKLSENEILNGDVGSTVGHGHEESLKILRLREEGQL